MLTNEIGRVRRGEWESGACGAHKWTNPLAPAVITSLLQKGDTRTQQTGPSCAFQNRLFVNSISICKFYSQLQTNTKILSRISGLQFKNNFFFETIFIKNLI